MSHDEDLNKAIQMEGILGKQRPGAFNVYQERYCRFLDGGLTLAYAASKEDFAGNKIKSQIALKDIQEIISDEKPKKFQLKLQDRIYKFEAASVEEKNKWVIAIKICKAHAIEVEGKNREQMLAFDDDIRFEDDRRNSLDPKSRFGLKKIAGGVTGVVTGVINEVVVKTVKKGVDAVGNAILDKTDKANDEYLKAKKLSEGLERVGSKMLQSRLLVGFLLKETKEATGLGVVDTFINDAGFRETIARRWCLLVSSKPILLDAVDPDDEATVENGKLPFEIEQEVLYIYDDSCDSSKPLESVQLKDVIDIVVKNKATVDQYYRFVLDLGDKKINLITTNSVERTKWVKAIQLAKANVKEKAKSKLPVVKNLYWTLKAFAEGGEEKLRAKISKDYDRITNNGEVMGANNVNDMLKVQERVSAEFITVINACLAHKDQRIDVIRVYVDVFHEGILSAIRSFFRRNQDNFENRDIYEIIKFLIWYRDRLRIFGDAFTDKRVVVGLGTLSKIVGTRMLKTQMRTVRNIVKQELEKEPEIDGRGKAATTAPSDVFKILNETFNTLSLCNTREVAFALLETCGHILEFFQNGMDCLIDQPSVTIDHLAAFCNNNLVYINNLKEFTKQAEQITGSDKTELAPFFNEEVYKKAFVPLGKRAQEKIAHTIFTSVGEKWASEPFLNIILETLLAEPIEKMNQLTEKVSTTLTIKIESACLEKVVTFYVQSFLLTAEKRDFRMDDLSRVSQKFEDDMRILGDLFSNLKKTVVDTCVSPINSFLDFLTSNYAFLPMAVQNMKESYGNSIKWSTIDLLIKLRNDHLNRDDRADLFRNCEEIYKTTQKKADKAKNFNVFKHLDQNGLTPSATQDLSRFASFVEEDDSNSDRSSSSGQSELITKKSASTLNLEGYLDVEKDEFLSNVGATLLLSNLKFETKYFNLKRDILYFYKDKNSEFSQGSYKLKEMSGFGKTENEDCGFYMTVKTKEGETKTVRFKASTPEKRDVWLEYIKDAAGLPDYGGMIELNAVDIQLFKDTRPLFADIEEMPNLEFSFTSNPNANKGGNQRRKRSFNLDEPIPKEGEPKSASTATTTASKAEEKNCLTNCAMF